MSFCFGSLHLATCRECLIAHPRACGPSLLVLTWGCLSLSLSLSVCLSVVLCGICVCLVVSACGVWVFLVCCVACVWYVHGECGVCCVCDACVVKSHVDSWEKLCLILISGTGGLSKHRSHVKPKKHKSHHFHSPQHDMITSQFFIVVMACLLVFLSFCQSHHQKVRRPLRTNNFAHQTCSCWPIVGTCWALFRTGDLTRQQMRIRQILVPKRNQTLNPSVNPSNSQSVNSVIWVPRFFFLSMETCMGQSVADAQQVVASLQKLRDKSLEEDVPATRSMECIQLLSTGLDSDFNLDEAERRGRKAGSIIKCEN